MTHGGWYRRTRYWPRTKKLDGYPNVVTSVVAAGNATLKHTDDWRLKLEAMLAQVRHALREGRAEQAMALSTQAQVPT